MIWSAVSFSSGATATEQLVVKMESKRGEKGEVYRPVFEAIAIDGSRVSYTGSTWMSPKPHSEGDRVDGFVDWSSGEMRSEKMLQFGKSFGQTFASLGGFFFICGSGYFWIRQRRVTP